MTKTCVEQYMTGEGWMMDAAQSGRRVEAAGILGVRPDSISIGLRGKVRNAWR